MSVIYKAGKVLPSPLADIGKQIYTNGNRLLGRNYFDYEYNDGELRLYYTEPTFVKMRDLIQDGVITIEDIPVDILEASEPIDATIDVGGHFGIYSVLLQVLNSDTELYTFEPSDENRIIIKELLAENNITGQVSEEVITDKTGTITFYIDPQAKSQSHATTPKEERDFQPVEMPSLALSDLVSRESLDRIYVKIDAEGEEMAVLQDLFTSNISYLEGIVELHPDKLDVPKSDIVDLLSQECNQYEFVTETTPDYKYDRPMYYFNYNH